MEKAQLDAEKVPDDALEMALAAAIDSRNAAATLIEQAEGKAANIQAFAGVMAGLVAGALAFLLGKLNESGPSKILGVALVSALIAMVCTSYALLRVHRATVVGNYRTHHPDPDQGLQFKSGGPNGMRRQLAAASYYAAANYLVGQHKSSVLRNAQISLMIGVIASVAVAMFVSLHMANS